MTIRDRGEGNAGITTLNHLWHASNTMLGTVPSVSAHLAGVLRFSVEDDRTSRLVQNMHCSHCQSLMTFSRVRVRKAKHRKRRGENPGNVLARTCAVCGRVSTMVVQSRKHAAEKPRKRIEPVIQKEAKKMGTPGGGERAKKRRRKRKSQSGVDEAERSQVRPQQTLQQPAGLFANSFLFQPLD